MSFYKNIQNIISISEPEWGYSDIFESKKYKFKPEQIIKFTDKDRQEHFFKCIHYTNGHYQCANCIFSSDHSGSLSNYTCPACLPEEGVHVNLNFKEIEI